MSLLPNLWVKTWGPLTQAKIKDGFPFMEYDFVTWFISYSLTKIHAVTSLFLSLINLVPSLTPIPWEIWEQGYILRWSIALTGVTPFFLFRSFFFLFLDPPFFLFRSFIIKQRTCGCCSIGGEELEIVVSIRGHRTVIRILLQLNLRKFSKARLVMSG